MQRGLLNWGLEKNLPLRRPSRGNLCPPYSVRHVNSSHVLKAYERMGETLVPLWALPKHGNLTGLDSSVS